jgi:3-hydroxybutyryl-CoA dehydrogenase
MGAGIAQLSAAAAMRTLLYDPVPEALERGTESARRGLAKWAEKGVVGADAVDLLQPVRSLDDLFPCDVVIEAAPERADVKRDLFGALSMVCGDEVVLATNTSSIPVTSLASAAACPERVVGMHFFNPPPLMPLLEVIRADQTDEDAVVLAKRVGQAMGKQVIVAADGPGFLVNRCGRPFSGEGLDLVGIDVGFEVAQSFNELAFGGEPRWRPSPLQARMVHAGRLGRKTGRGWYEYADDGSYREDDPEPPEPGGGDGTALAILGGGPLADDLRDRARTAGYELREGGPTELVLDAGIQPHPSPPGGAPLGLLCAASSLSSRGELGAVGFHALPGARLAELTRLPTTQRFAADAMEELFVRLGFVVEWVEDAPGLVLGRIVSQLVNEAAFAIGEGVGTADDVDTGLKLGLSHPRGPVEWSEALGVDHVLAVLDGLWAERREERYRAAPLLRRAGALGRGLRD